MAWIIYAERAIFENTLDPGRLVADFASYQVANAMLIALYVLMLALAAGGRLTGRSRAAALALPVAFHLALVPVRPYLSVDLFTYLAHGAQAVFLGVNPYAVPAADVAATPFGRELIAAGWSPTVALTPYGPLWTGIEIGSVWLTRDVAGAMLLIKGLVAAASLGSAALIWAILGRVRPAQQLFGTLAYLWSPLILFELAGEGHNDALMILFVLAAIYAAIRSWPGAAVVAMGLGALTKLLPVIFLPALAVHLWRGDPERPSRLRGAAAGLLVAAGVTVASFAPFWVGGQTLAGVTAGIELGRDFASTKWAMLELVGGLIPDAAASLLLGTIFLIAVVAASRSAREPGGLLRACAWTALAYVLVASPYFWPWHAALPIALMALSPSGAFRWGLVALAIGPRMVAPLDDMFANGFGPLDAHVALTFCLGIAMPGLVLLAAHLRSRLSTA